jgi:hypothetical protein
MGCGGGMSRPVQRVTGPMSCDVRRYQAGKIFLEVEVHIAMQECDVCGKHPDLVERDMAASLFIVILFLQPGCLLSLTAKDEVECNCKRVPRLFRPGNDVAAIVNGSRYEKNPDH